MPGSCVEVHPLADARQRPPLPIEPSGFVDLFGGESACAVRDAAPSDDLVDRLVADVEPPLRQVVDRVASDVGGDAPRPRARSGEARLLW